MVKTEIPGSTCSYWSKFEDATTPSNGASRRSVANRVFGSTNGAINHFNGGFAAFRNR
ncbi:hypothetical protein O9992_18730 [Vibrio lentus]|nr:hypothetical protein [Vibrio lentus]